MLSSLERNDSVLEKSNSIIVGIYDLPSKTSSSIYLNEEDLRINYRKDSLYTLAKDLLPIQYQRNKVVNPRALLNAVNWIIELRKISSSKQLWWSRPLANIVESEIIFEWWRNEKKITVYISSDTVEFIKVWGADIDSEMEEGVAETNIQIEALWRWIAS